jgi:cell division protein FtsB
MHPDAPRPPRSSGVPRRPANADALSSPRPKASPSSTGKAGGGAKTPAGAASGANAPKRDAASSTKAAKAPKAPKAAPGTSSSTKAPTSAPKAGTTKPARARSRRATRAAGSAGAAGAVAADRAGWLSGIRFSGFSVIMMGVLVLAVVVLAPTIAAFAQQRQQIAELRAAVSQQEDEVQRLRDERERWNDETFIMTKARERLYYVMPGEVSYLVIDDRTEAAKADAAAEVSADVTESKGDWMRTLLDSVMTAGLAPTSTDAPAPAVGSAR